MKRAKLVFMTTAIVAAVCCAFVTKPDPICEDCRQFYTLGDKYMDAGIYGVDFDCDYQVGVPCTYYQPDPVSRPYDYVMCHQGGFILIPSATKGK